MEEQTFVSGKNDAIDILKYRQERINITQDFISQDAITPISQVFTLTKSEQFDAVIKKYQDISDRLAQLPVPSQYKVSHQANLLLFKKIIGLYTLRKEYILKKKTDDPEFQSKAKEKSVEAIWAFRRLNEEEKKQELQQTQLSQ